MLTFLPRRRTPPPPHPRLLAALFLALLLSLPAAAAPPQRIVSLNLCTDQMLIELVGRERIAAVSALAVDPQSSALAEEARGLPVTRGAAEEVLALRPDLVLAGTYTTRGAVAILRRLGVPVVEVPPEQSLADVRAHLRLVGEAVGEPARAEALVARFDRELAAAAVEEAGPRPVFTNYGPNGFTAGAGTLEADVAHAAGYDLLGERLGIAGSGEVPLEVLLTSSVDVIAISRPTSSYPSLAEARLAHPALRRYASARATVDVPPALWSCGTPATVEAVRILAGARPGRPRRRAPPASPRYAPDPDHDQTSRTRRSPAPASSRGGRRRDPGPAEASTPTRVLRDCSSQSSWCGRSRLSAPACAGAPAGMT